MDEPIYRMLGLCMKAGKLLSGNEQVSEGLKKRQAVLLIVTEDSSPRTKDEYIKAAERLHLPCRLFGEKERLGQALGKGVRTAALITDQGFGRAIAEKIDRRKS
ncbi:ribosomal L7Ae/L30e/S12e/Gadd45 family protein [Dialister sp.]|jgi:ribosomal protein L7Ae-like RNA K-turn-binding protein|uniref:L7Ae/L30e/S12e/Gadd45 family ribosomal protein n=2 Tax=Dialister TaxID=39948 RepID=UPI0025D78B6D|nr:ribosomal L7Ae/L30e/S12e/Gadd45 family protein [Dialister sp.]